MLDLLDLAAGEVPPEPQLARDAHPEARRMLQVSARADWGWACRPVGRQWGRAAEGSVRRMLPCLGMLCLHLAPLPSHAMPASSFPALTCGACAVPCLQALELDALLAGGATVAAGGVRTVSHRGVGLYDVVALKDELMKR